MKYSDVREVRRCKTEEEANALMAEGWELLNVAEVRWTERRRGLLGRPFAARKDVVYIVARARWSEGQLVEGEQALAIHASDPWLYAPQAFWNRYHGEGMRRFADRRLTWSRSLAGLSFAAVGGAVVAGLNGAPPQNVALFAAVAGAVGILALFADADSRGWE